MIAAITTTSRTTLPTAAPACMQSLTRFPPDVLILEVLETNLLSLYSDLDCLVAAGVLFMGKFLFFHCVVQYLILLRHALSLDDDFDCVLKSGVREGRDCGGSEFCEVVAAAVECIQIWFLVENYCCRNETEQDGEEEEDSDEIDDAGEAEAAERVEEVEQIDEVEAQKNFVVVAAPKDEFLHDYKKVQQDNHLVDMSILIPIFGHLLFEHQIHAPMHYPNARVDFPLLAFLLLGTCNFPTIFSLLLYRLLVSIC